MADDLGYADLGCYGATKVETPHCDRLAREGRRFTDAHTPSAVCSPTRFGLLTGAYPWREGRVPRHLHASEPLVIRDGEPTIASLLQAAGYATGCVGKWHLGAQRQNPIDWDQPLTPGPNDVGFDQFFGAINSHNQAPYVWVRNAEILDRKPGESIRVEGNRTQTSGRQTRDSFDGERMLAEEAGAFIEQHADEPFFLYYPTSAIHTPITPGKRWQGTSQVGAYGDYIQEFDWEVGQVLETLDRLKLTERTLVIVTSDNGPLLTGRKFGHNSVGPLRGSKTTVYEGGHRVPFLVRWPGRVPAGTTCDETISHVDILATLCTAAGVDVPSDAAPDSYNVLPAFVGEQYDEPLREATVAVSQNATDRSIRQGPWKLVVLNYPSGQRELYNLADDLAESRNLVDEQPEIAERLYELLRTYDESGRSATR